MESGVVSAKVRGKNKDLAPTIGISSFSGEGSKENWRAEAGRRTAER